MNMEQPNNKQQVNPQWALEIKLPPIPHHLPLPAKQIFINVGQTLVSAGILKVIDGRQLELLAVALHERDKIQKQMDLEGFVVYNEKTLTNSKGTTVIKSPKKNPAFEIFVSLNKLINEQFDKFGMNPASRNKFVMPEIEPVLTEEEQEIKRIMEDKENIQRRLMGD